MTEARLELVWPGKDKFLLVPKDTDGKPVWVERDHPAASEVRLADFTDVVGDVPEDPYAANLLFTGASVITLAAATCNGSGSDAVSAYFAEAHPVTVGSTGQRSFGTDTRGTIYFDNTGATMTAGMAGASVLQ